MGRVRSGLRRLRARTAGELRPDEDGFTIVEVMVALTIMFVALLSLVYTITNSFQHIALARQRQEAHAVADRYLERIRALPYDTVKLGMRTADLVADPTNVQPVPFGYRLKTTNERIPNGSGVPLVQPLVPNAHTENVGNNAYQVRTFITYHQDDDTTGVFRASVIVTWQESIRDRPGRIVAETVIFSPQGCLSTATHAYSGPCQAQSMADAAVTAGPLALSGRNLSNNAVIPGGSLAMPNSNAGIQIEQLSNVTGASQTSSIALAADDSLGQPAQIAARQQVQTAADNDPAVNGANDYETGSAPAQVGATLTRAAGLVSFEFDSSTGDTGVSTSTVRANGLPTYACASNTSPPAPQLDELPCGSNQALQADAARAVVDVQNPSVGSLQAAEILDSPAPAASYVNRDLTDVATSPCYARGCVHAAANRAIGVTSLGGMPTGLPAPSGWAGHLVRLSGYADMVSAEAGIAAASASATRVGLISYWNGAGYSTISAVGSPGASIPIPPVTAVTMLSVNQEWHRVEITANLAKSAMTQTSPSSTCSGSLTCIKDAEARAPSPITGTIVYRFYEFTQPVVELTIDVNLGESVVSATYQDPPSA